MTGHSNLDQWLSSSASHLLRLLLKHRLIALAEYLKHQTRAEEMFHSSCPSIAYHSFFFSLGETAGLLCRLPIRIWTTRERYVLWVASARPPLRCFPMSLAGCSFCGCLQVEDSLVLRLWSSLSLYCSGLLEQALLFLPRWPSLSLCCSGLLFLYR